MEENLKVEIDMRNLKAFKYSFKGWGTVVNNFFQG